MDHFAGLDVSVKETSVCIVDDTSRIVREVKVASEPDALLRVLGNLAYHFKRIGLEAGPLSQWPYSALAEAGLPVICVESRHMRAEGRRSAMACAYSTARPGQVAITGSLAFRRSSDKLFLRRLDGVQGAG
jgi:transposase